MAKVIKIGEEEAQIEERDIETNVEDDHHHSKSKIYQ